MSVALTMVQVRAKQGWWKWPQSHRWEIAERYFYGEDAASLAEEYRHDPRAVRAWLCALGIFDPKRRLARQHEAAMRSKARRERVEAMAVSSPTCHPFRSPKAPTDAIRRLARCLLVAMDYSATGKVSEQQIGRLIEAARWWGGTESWHEREEAAAGEAASD